MRHAAPIALFALFTATAAGAGLGGAALLPEHGVPGLRLGTHSVAPPGAVAPPAEEDCGLSTDLVPDFALVDQNPNSATYGQTWTRDGQLGQVLVIYWAQAT